MTCFSQKIHLSSYSICLHCVTDAIIESIGCKDDISFKIPDHKKLSYHCKNFGHYARYCMFLYFILVNYTCN